MAKATVTNDEEKTTKKQAKTTRKKATKKVAQACQLMREVLINNLEKQQQILEYL